MATNLAICTASIIGQKAVVEARRVFAGMERYDQVFGSKRGKLVDGGNALWCLLYNVELIFRFLQSSG